MSPLLTGAGKLVTADIGKDEVLNAFFASVFTSKNCFQESHTPEQKSGARKIFLTSLRKDQIREHINKVVARNL